MANDLTILTNIASLNAQRYMGEASTRLTKAQRELGSGSRVSDPSTDPSAAAIGFVIQSEINILEQASRNSVQASAMLQMYVGALNQTADILMDIYNLTTQARSDAIDNDKREILDKKLQQFLKQIDTNAHIKWGNNEFFNNNSPRYVQINHGQGADDLLEIQFQDATLSGLGLVNIDVKTFEGASNAQTALNDALQKVSQWIADLGALKTRLEYDFKDNEITVQGLKAALSTFVDADISDSLMEVQENQALFDMATAVFNRAMQRAEQLAKIVQIVLNGR